MPFAGAEALCRRFEQGPHGGPALRPYLCPAGFWTLGWGSTRGLDGKLVTADTAPITAEQADWLLLRDLTGAAGSMRHLITRMLADGQQDALVSWVYNLGGARLKGSTLRAKINRGEDGGVPAEIKKWVYGGGRKLAGLVIRRELEAAMYAMASP